MQETRSVRDNILFFAQQVDQSWYNTCLKATTLTEDIAHWAEADATLAKHLSGGQRQRVALARTLYASPNLDALLLDDAFSALDARVESHILSKLFDAQSGLLKAKTTVLVTNAPHIVNSLSHFHVKLSQDGTIESAGSPASLLCSVQAARRDDLRRDPRLSNGDQLTEITRERSSSVIEDDHSQVDEKELKVQADKAAADDVEQVSQSKINFSTYKVWFAMASYSRLLLVLFFNASVIATTVGAQVLTRGDQAMDLLRGS